MAVTAYNLALFVHLLGAVTLFGGITIIQWGGARLRAAVTVEEVRRGLGFCGRPGGCSRQGSCYCLPLASS